MANLLSPGSLVSGRYYVLGLAGSGGMGAVYKAADVQLGGRIVALKEMSESGLDPQELVEATDAFKREALLLASLHHPSLPTIYDHFTSAGHWYLVMEFIEGETLENYLQHEGHPGLPVADVLFISDELCEVLEFLHYQVPPIIFRDVKPSNVMMTSSGPRPGQLQLIDFGIARLFKPGQSHDTIWLGSPGYAAPEQYGKSQTTVRSDIFSLGVLLHQLLTGIDPALKPFTFPSIRLYSPQVPSDLEALIVRMVQLDAGMRPPSVRVVRQELDQIAGLAGATYSAGLPQSVASACQAVPMHLAASSPSPIVQPNRSASQRRTQRVPTLLLGIGAAVLVACVLIALCGHSINQEFAALQISQATAAVQSTLDDAVATANDQLSNDLDSLTLDVGALPDSSDFSSDLSAYATDWAHMQEDYQQEKTDYKQGCGPNGYNASVVNYDASVVSYDLSVIQYDDSVLNSHVSALTDPQAQVTHDIQTVQADLQMLEAALAADPQGSTSTQHLSPETVNTALADAQHRVDTLNTALNSAQSKAKQYDKEAAQTNTTAQNLANSMSCQ